MNQLNTQNVSKLNQSEYSRSLIVEKHFGTMVIRDSRLVSLPIWQRAYLQLFGRLCLSMTCLHLLSRDPWMTAWLSLSACTCRPVFRKQVSSLGTGLSAWPYKTLVSAHGPNDTCCCKTASCSPHHCITTMIFYTKVLTVLLFILHLFC